MIEMIVVIALSTIVTLALTNSIASFYRVNGYTIAQSYQVSYARDGMEQLIRDLREMTFADDGSFPLAIMEENKITFYSDIDRDDSVEYIEYELIGTNLEKKVFNAAESPLTYGGAPESTVVLSQYVQNDLQSIPMFVYYDALGNPASATSTVADIRYVQASIIVNVDPVRDPGEYMLRSSASLRNLKGIQ